MLNFKFCSLCLFVIFLVRGTSGETVFKCIRESQSRQTVSLSCPLGRVIRVVEALYGRNQWKQCMYTVGDCTERVILDPECCGRRQCNFTLWKYSIQCDYVTFFRVIYECVEAEDSQCRVFHETGEGEFDIEEEDEEDEEDVVTSLKFPLIPSAGVPTHNNHIPTAKDPKENHLSVPAMPTKQDTKTANEESGYLAVILGSAVAVAFLLAAIIVVIFLLRRYKWNGEKECILQLFVGLCKRHPPDGCENPEGEERACAGDVHQYHQGISQDDKVTRYNMNDKHFNVGKHLDISKNMPTKSCNIDVQNLQNETKLENCERVEKSDNSDDINAHQCQSQRQAAQGNTDSKASYKVGLNRDGRDAENNYVEFDKVLGERYSNPVLRKMNPKRIVIDSTKADVTYTISEEPGTTAV